MKKVFLGFLLMTSIAACTNSSDKDRGGSDSTSSVNKTAKARNSDADTNSMKIGTEPMGGEAGSSIGKAIIAKSDCYTCHKVESKLIGPAFNDIASKYPASAANLEMLSNKIIYGGKGNWGDISMSPHPSLSRGDAKEAAKYILSLKK